MSHTESRPRALLGNTDCVCVCVWVACLFLFIQCIFFYGLESCAFMDGTAKTERKEKTLRWLRGILPTWFERVELRALSFFNLNFFFTN